MSPCDIKSTHLVNRLVQYVHDGECQTELTAFKSQSSNLARAVSMTSLGQSIVLLTTVYAQCPSLFFIIVN